MGKMELEVKVLNINENEIIEKIEKLGGKLVQKSNQYLYTYDLPTIYGRYMDILLQLNEPESNLKFETALSKLKLLFFELDNLLYGKDNCDLINIIKSDNFTNILQNDNLLEILNSDNVINFIKKFRNNSKKWIRLRKTNDKTTLVVKHILAENGSNIQQMLENEIDVPSMEEANSLLEALGFSYKSYQEKRRVTYKLNNHEIEIDTWPGLPTYFEVEGTSEEDLENILKLLGYTIKDTVSCTADDIYVMNGISMFEQREIKFK